MHRSARNSKQIERLGSLVTYLHTKEENADHCNTSKAHILETIIEQVCNKNANEKDNKVDFAQTCNMKQAERKFGNQDTKVACEELEQLDHRELFDPVKLESLADDELRKAIESLFFVTEKKDGRIKGRGCETGSTQRSCIPKEDATSLTVAIESVLIAGVTDEKQERDVMTLDIPNEFVQTLVPPSK